MRRWRRVDRPPPLSPSSTFNETQIGVEMGTLKPQALSSGMLTAHVLGGSRPRRRSWFCNFVI